MELVVPISPPRGFGFDTPAPFQSLTAPSSPKPFGDPLDYFYNHASAPTSPTRAAAIYAHFSSTTTSSPISFDWDEKLGDDIDPFDFAFELSSEGDKGSLPPTLATADELFEAGMIRPLRTPPPPNHPRRGGGEGERIDSLLAEIEESTRDRGRERTLYSPSVSSSKNRRESRSLSPLRGEGVFLKTPNNSPLPSTTTSSSTKVVCGGSRRWRLRDLLLFRSGSEGRATGRESKDPLRKYSTLSYSLIKRSGGEDSKSSSFGSATKYGSKGGPIVSAHEIHYTANRATSEEQKKKTPLPYQKHSLFGYLRFNPAINSIARGFNGYSLGRGRS